MVIMIQIFYIWKTKQHLTNKMTHNNQKYKNRIFFSSEGTCSPILPKHIRPLSATGGFNVSLPVILNNYIL
jgi:hypothetical protein